MINGSFVIIEINGRFLFIKRNDNKLWDLVGGGFDVSEIDYKGVVIREGKEEIGYEIPRKKIQLCAILGQKLKAEITALYNGVENGFVFLHCCILYEMPNIQVGLDEHSEYQLFTYEQIIADYKAFSSGILWMFFAFMKFRQTCRITEGRLYEYRNWQGKEYV